ncbi:MAG: Hsp70 family protein [Nannocystis sp.]|nr:Hsp70 family protein [Nannocystis sp.]
MITAPRYVGIDLGTTNSTAAVFDGDRVTLVRNAQGGHLTPSIVRIDARGGLTIGARARRYLESDPENTRSEFKRLMGTGQELLFPASGRRLRPQELSAELLRALRADIEEQFGFVPDHAVISVPALFELPQSDATAEAARLAGFQRIELIQEPIASALAAGWTAEESAGAWLVYDLGGGTFDVSLLETRDGLLRVIGHDGDNFLGGRDFDWALVEWALGKIKEQSGLDLSRADPAHAPALRKLKLAAEEAKIELTRAERTTLSIPALTLHQGAPYDLDLPIDRATLERLCAPIIDRSVEVCRRLLAAHGLAPGGLDHVVMVGGPSVTPLVRQRVSAGLGVALSDGLDPMTLVAQGAAIYAATAGLDARPSASDVQPGHRVWLHYPAMSSDLTPHVVGRLVEPKAPGAPTQLRLRRGDDLWEGPWADIDAEASFILSTSLLARRANVFRIEARAADGKPVEVSPPAITIVQGLTIHDPPLSRTIGVALANDQVRVYFERGAPLPARRTFTLYTVAGVIRGSEDDALKIPIVQGEYDEAHFCRLVGALVITGKDLKDSLPSGSEIEMTLELDRGGRLSARALIPALAQVFEDVAQLLVPLADPEVLAATFDVVRGRIAGLRADAFRRGAIAQLDRLSAVQADLDAAHVDLEAARGGDADAAQKARRALLEIDADLEQLELDRRWPELDREARESTIWASSWVSELGLPHEQRLLDETMKALDKARQERDPLELQRQLRLVSRLGNTASLRHPEAWSRRFESAASEISGATDLVKAQALVKEGREALARGDQGALRAVTQKLWQLLPSDVERRRLGYDSGVR